MISFLSIIRFVVGWLLLIVIANFLAKEIIKLYLLIKNKLKK
jgi:hypothetical protein